MKNFLVISFLFVSLTSCNREAKIREYLAYLNDKDNGLLQEKSVGGIVFKAKYLPPDYQAYLANNGTYANQNEKNEAEAKYSKTLCFMISIRPDNSETDILRLNASGYREFAERVEILSFDAYNFIGLECGDKKLKPTIAFLENLNSPEQSRNIIIGFEKTKLDPDEEMLLLTFRDELFGTGLSKFCFQTKDLSSTPKIQLAQK
jgi:hypothetical protein